MAGVASSPEREALRAEVEAAVADEIGRLGPDGLNKNGVARRFTGRGVSSATLYRWVDALVRDGTAGRRHAAQVKRAVAARAAGSGDPAADAAREAAAVVPVLPSVEEITAAGSTVDVIAGLQRCIRAAEEVMAFARHADGKVRVPLLMLRAAEVYRRCLETSVRVNEALWNAAAIERFTAAIVDEIARESPEAAQRVTWRLQAMTRIGAEEDAGLFSSSSRASS